MCNNMLVEHYCLSSDVDVNEDTIALWIELCGECLSMICHYQMLDLAFPSTTTYRSSLQVVC